VSRQGRDPSLLIIKKDETFKDFIQDQLNGIEKLAARSLFGAYGLYQGSRFFDIIFRGRLYFKTDRSSQAPYRERGMKPFRPNPKQTLNSYFDVPGDVIEEADELAAWANAAIACCKERR
jgi:DNA transformation protein